MRSLVVSLDVFGAMIYYFYDPNFVSIEVGARRSVTSLFRGLEGVWEVLNLVWRWMDV